MALCGALGHHIFPKRTLPCKQKGQCTNFAPFTNKVCIVDNDGGCSLYLLMADDGSHPWPDDGLGIVLAMLLDGNGSRPEDGPGIVLAS